MTIHIPPGGFDKSEMFPNQLMALVRGVGETIERIRYDRLKSQLLQGVNPEVNTDREVLISRMEQLGFRRDIVEALNDLDRKIMAAGKPLDFKGCMDVVRTIYEEMVEDAAKAAARLTKSAVPSGKLKDFQPWKDLLVSAKVVTSEEADLLQKFYNYFSNVGTHRLGSQQEHVRVAKNTMIEWGLLIVGRVHGWHRRGEAEERHGLRPLHTGLDGLIDLHEVEARAHHLGHHGGEVAAGILGVVDLGPQVNLTDVEPLGDGSRGHPDVNAEAGPERPNSRSDRLAHRAGLAPHPAKAAPRS